MQLEWQDRQALEDINSLVLVAQLEGIMQVPEEICRTKFEEQSFDEDARRQFNLPE